MNMDQITKLTGRYAEAREALSNLVGALNAEVEAAKKVYIRDIRKAVQKTKEVESELRNALLAAPELFTKPRSQVISGIKIGYKKGSGKLEFEDADTVIKLIRKHYPDQADVLIITVEKPAKDALENLSAAELKKLGITVEGTGDVVFVKDTASDVDKLVKALLKDSDEEE